MNSELLKQLKKEGYTDLKIMYDKIYGLHDDFMFTTAIVKGLDEYGYYGRWCYSNEYEARDALETWDGLADPPGNWIVYKGEPKERHNPNYKSPS